MKKRRLFFLLLCVMLAYSCGKAEQPEYAHIYDWVLEMHDRMWRDESYEYTGDLISEGMFVGSHHTEIFTPGYCIKDLTGNGIPELVVGVKESGEDNYQVKGVYVYTDGKVVLAMGGSKYMVEVYQNGIAEENGADAFGEWYGYYHLSGKWGCEWLETFEIRYDEGDSEEFYIVHGEEIGEVETKVTEEEFYQRKSVYTEEKEKLEWKELIGFWNES